jgi:hypothetical protein
MLLGVRNIQPQVDMSNLSDVQAKLLFRFTISEIEQLTYHLQLPDTVSINSDTRQPRWASDRETP